MKFPTRLFTWFVEGVAGFMMAAIFVTFIVQIVVRYVVGAEWFVSATGGIVDTADFGWTVELILVLWLWTIFWGNAFVVQESDHVTFDIIYNLVGSHTRTIFTIVGALIIVVAAWSSIEPTYDRMKLLRLKSSATLPVKMLDIYSVYFLFLGAIGLRYLWRAVYAMRHGAEREPHFPAEEPVRHQDEVS